MTKTQEETTHLHSNNKPQDYIQKEPRQKLKQLKLLKANSLKIIPRKLRYSRKYQMTGKF
jgi:hypothetical protein